MEYKIKNLSEHEKKELLNAVVEIINREGPMYVRALYETLRREHNISLFGQNIVKDLLCGDPRFVMKGTFQEQIALSEETENEEKTSSIYSLCRSLLDFNKSHVKYSEDDIEFLCGRLKDSGFKNDDLISGVFQTLEEAKNEVLLKYA